MSITDAQKAEAVRLIIESALFRRAEVLKTILAYLCKQESLGRAADVSETEIAVDVLGRGQNFSPDLDSSVRNRVMALRKKLDDYYATEGVDKAIRVEIPRGAYSLRFAATEHESAEQTDRDVSAGLRLFAFWRRNRAFLGGAAVGALIMALGFALWAVAQREPTPAGERNLIALWGPMAVRGATVTIAVATPASLLLRDFGNAEAPVELKYGLPVPRTPEFEDWYKREYRKNLGKAAFFQLNARSPLWGDAVAAFVVGSRLGQYGAKIEMMSATQVTAAALRDKNVVIIGSADYPDSIAGWMPGGGLSVEHNAVHRMVGIHNRSPRPKEPEWWFPSDNYRHSYGLITVASSDSTAKRRTMILSGINSDGAEAAARYFTSEDNVNSLLAEFRRAGRATWPDRYQVLVETESLDTYNLRTKVKHVRVFD
ncbi:MAG: hypothetical protein NTW74_11970 [Acidobacteria bacterium]|nr:hypothetical protein [Acidobacteriota bacterium]